MNLPNKLTLARLILVPVLIITYLFPYTYLGIHMPTFELLSAHLSLKDIIVFIIFAVASFTDFLDGYIARRDNLVTTFGKFVDPIADKLIVNNAEDSSPYGIYTYSYRMKGNYQKSLEYAEKGLSLNSEDSDLYRQKAITLLLSIALFIIDSFKNPSNILGNKVKISIFIK